MISVIIPVLDDERRIVTLLDHLNKIRNTFSLEIIVVDGGSEKVPELSRWPWVRSIKTGNGRAIQMNAGAKTAKGDLLYFVHADALPPSSFPEDISAAVRNGHALGCYRSRLVPSNVLTNINSYFSRFNSRFSGGGDQTLYIKKEIFDKEGGFNESYCIMEDFELVRRLKPKYGYYIIPKEVMVSARKYKANNYLQVTLANYKAFKMFERGEKPERIKNAYYSWIKRGD
jgi:rSAM/selenodomain-associated transferase 2